MAFRSSSMSIATIFLLALVMTTVDSRVLPSGAPPPPAGDKARAASEEVMGLTRALEFAPPAPRANINPDPGAPIPLRG
ncbi:hypothetical protein QJS10_CPB14g00202 [Acorus calamus]|uniref:Uncharacterized protein n=1 Tax=Acorus calamus TaxID=4465 RepID=A0AAV9DG48_ACOCL|nr:hypothetical protein QJS10_CPB14g00202 [Acorus calamus]